jgi:hypothetical protein
VSDRGRQILARFPAHLEAARPGKQFSAAVGALADDLDVLSAALAAVRRAHRLAHADTLTDVLRLGALHGLTKAELSVLFLRADHLRTLAGALAQAAGGSATDRDGAAEALLDLFGIEGTEPRLALFAPLGAEGAPPDLDGAARTLAATTQGLIASRRLVEASRARVQQVCRIHAAGNGTVRALLLGAANALDLDLDTDQNAAVRAALQAKADPAARPLDIGDEFFHSQDRFWHATYVRDRAPLVRTVPSRAPAQRVLMGASIAVSELADQMGLQAPAVLARTGEVGLADLGPATPLDLDAADRLAALFGFAVERVPRGVVRMERALSVAALATQLGLRVDALLPRLAALGATGLTAGTLLPPELTAQAARRYGYQVEQTLPTQPDVLGIEENPLRRETRPTEECPDGHRFQVIRRGFDRALLQIQVAGRENRTVGPMVVNRDEGHGVGFFGAVPAGQTLTFTEEGRVTLEGSDVTPLAFSWEGACFADAGEANERDFVFAGRGAAADRQAGFAVATPAGALDRDAAFPHAGLSISVPGVGIGVTRLASFVQVAHLSSREGAAEVPVIRRVTPHPCIGFADRSVFATDPAGGEGPVAAGVTLSWLEHEAYALRVILPRRMALLDQEGELPVTDRVGAALERFRPAGVQVRVEYLDDRWRLGQGFLAEDLEAEDPILRLRGGTVLSSPPAEGT